MFDRSHGRFEFLLAVTLVGRTQMLYQKPEWNLLRDFERPLDFIHCLDSCSAINRGYVDWRRPGAAPLVVGIQWRVHRVKRNAAALEPVRDFAHMRLAVGIVEMLTRGKNFHRLHAAAG